MRKNSYWDTLGNTIETVNFIVYGLPLLIVIISIMCGVSFVHHKNLERKVDKDYSIFYTELDDTVYEIAKRNVDSNLFSVEPGDLEIYDVELEYTIKNNEYSKEQYDSLFKQEITKVYNEIKDKKLINDTLFGDDKDLDRVEIKFSFDNEDNDYIGGGFIRYSLIDWWDTGYNNLMSDTLVSHLFQEG